MPSNQSMSEEKLHQILHHNNRLITIVQHSLAAINAIADVESCEAMNGQRKYWQHCISCLKWSNQIAEDTFKGKKRIVNTTI